MSSISNKKSKTGNIFIRGLQTLWSPFSCFNRSDWIVILSNVLFFMLVQTAFFWYIASKQYENVLSSKLDTLKLLASKNSTFKRKLDNFKDEYISKHEQKAKELETERAKLNKKLTWKYCGKLIVVTTLVLFAIVISYFFVKGRPWNDVDTLNMIFVTLAYCTELFFFFFIVREYEFVGDNYILTSVLQNIINEERTSLGNLIK